MSVRTPAAGRIKTSERTSSVADRDSGRGRAIEGRYGAMASDRGAEGGPASREAPSAGGLPAPLKRGVESLSGLNLDGVRVRYDSPEPSRYRACAFARGTEIHLGPGHERSLPHEAWHVVQQKQGRVAPTRSLGGSPLNDEPALEREAEVMGRRAERWSASMGPLRGSGPANRHSDSASPEQGVTGSVSRGGTRPSPTPASSILQRDVGFEFETRYLRTWRYTGGSTFPANWTRKGHGESDNDFYKRYMAAGRRLPKGRSGAFLTHADFTVEADDRGTDESSGEIVTTHFPETPLGRTRLDQALTAMVNMEQRLVNMPTDQLATPTDLAGGGLNASRTNVFLTPPQPVYGMGWKGAPQMTMGLGLADIPTVIQDLIAAPGETVVDAATRLPGRSIVRSNPTADPHSDEAVGALVDAVGLADQALATYLMGHALAPNPASAELRGFLTLIISYREGVRAGAVRNFLKQATALLAKTDFATMFRQLPGPERAYYAGKSKLSGAMNPPLVDLVASVPNYGTLMNQPLFDTAVPAADEIGSDGREWYKDLVFEDWIAAMTSGRDKLKDKLVDKIRGRGQDLLTTGNFPNLPRGRELEGFAPLGSRLDAPSRPVLELRAFNKDMTLTQFKPAALKLYDYIVSLNQGARTPIV